MPMKVSSKPHLHASWIDGRAKDIVRRLQSKGFTTYLVGGCVRDLLVGVHPKDFDIATSALPNDVRKLISGAYVIGKRFRLVLVRRGDDQFEVATFRRAGRAEDFENQEDAPIGDNFFGTPEEDALRRDFTINALFFDPVSGELIDYADAKKDIESSTLRMIGDPKTRIVEDSIRSLRAVRLSHKIKFQIEPSLRRAIQENAEALQGSALPRRREEYLKIMKLENPSQVFFEMWDLGLIHVCLPSLIPVLESSERAELFFHYLENRHLLMGDSSRPTDIFLPLVLGFQRATEGLEKADQIRDHFFRNELSVFKSESAEIESSAELRERLQNIEGFKKRGARRQKAFLSHPGLDLALRIAEFERELCPQDLWYWKSKIADYFDSEFESEFESGSSEPDSDSESGSGSELDR